MTRILSLAIVLLAVLAGSAGAQEPSAAPREPALREELLRMHREDQAVRNRAIEVGFATGSAPDSLMRRWMAVDSANLLRVKAIVARHGWPTTEMVGRDGVGAMFTLVQHADREPAFQQAMLPHVLAAWRRGDGIQGQDVALLTDRVLSGQGLPQRYGSQTELVDGRVVVKPMEDPENVDARRREMGLPPMAEYLELLARMYRAQPADSSSARPAAKP